MWTVSRSSGQAKSLDPPAYHHGDLRRALIEPALALVTEEQDWTFSLREVARRAGVSHNAPYNHFADKRDLLAAVAVVGFATLGERIQAATSGIANARTALVKSAVVYVTFGVENPAHYRLMFGSALVTALEGRPKAVAEAGARSSPNSSTVALGDPLVSPRQNAILPGCCRPIRIRHLRALVGVGQRRDDAPHLLDRFVLVFRWCTNVHSVTE
jgi:AcrR family transcriptional regulator